MAYVCPLNWTAVSGATGYKVYRDQDVGEAYLDSSPVSVGAVTSYDVPVSTSGTWYLAVSAIVGGVEGGLSQETAVVASGSGSPPTGTITLSVR